MGLSQLVLFFSLPLAFYYIPMTYLFYDGHFLPFDPLTYFANLPLSTLNNSNFFSDFGAYWTNLQGTGGPNLILAVSKK